MSDEPQLPALRLKPRAQPAGETSPGQAQETPQAAAAEQNTTAGTGADTPLKLKLKSRSASEEAPAPTPQTPGAQEAAATSGGSAERIRLKPKLVQTPDPDPKAVEAAPAPEPAKAPEPEVQPALIAPPPPAPELPQTIPPTIPPTIPSVPSGGSEPGNKFRLKSKAGTGDSKAPILFSPPDASPAPEVAAETSPKPEAPIPPATAEAPKTKVPHIRAPLGKAPEASDNTEKASQERQKKSLRFLITIGGAALALVLLVGAFLLWQMFSEPEPPPPLQRTAKPAPAKATPASPVPPKAEAAAATPQPKPVGPAEAPKREQTAISNIIPMTMPVSSLKDPIDKTKEVIAAVRESEQKRVDEVLDNPQPAAKPAASPAPVANTEQPPAPKPMASPEPSQPKAAAAPAPSSAFKRFVSDCNITGVFQGARPKALINGRTFSAGDLVDKPLGIIFDKVDAETHMITFRDATGATVSRKY